MRELIDAMEDNWSKWQTREGIKRLPESRPGLPDRRDSPAPGPIRSIVVGWVPIRSCCQRGGSGSPTFWSVIRRSKPTIASGSPVSSSAKASARRSIARESWLEIVVSGGRDERERERRGGDRRSCRAA